MNTETVTDTTKVYYVVKWRNICLEYEFKNNAQYLDAIAVAETVIVTMLRDKGVTIPILKVHLAKKFDALAFSLVPTVRAMASQGSPGDKMPALNQKDLLPIWGDKMDENNQGWFSYYHILKKLKFVGDHCGKQQIFYEAPAAQEEVPCELCAKDFLKRNLPSCCPQICPTCVTLLDVAKEEEEEEEEPVQKKKHQKIGLCAVCLDETHRRCSCKEIYYCSSVCSKKDWKAHKKTCCYDGR
jgi:hypothetical protein